jgi:hypothetical protein
LIPIYLCKFKTSPQHQHRTVQADMLASQRRLGRRSQHHAPICDRSWLSTVHSSDVCKPRHTVGWYPTSLHRCDHDSHSDHILVLRRCITTEEQNHGQRNLDVATRRFGCNRLKRPLSQETTDSSLGQVSKAVRDWYHIPNPYSARMTQVAARIWCFQP